MNDCCISPKCRQSLGIFMKAEQWYRQAEYVFSKGLNSKSASLGDMMHGLLAVISFWPPVVTAAASPSPDFISWRSLAWQYWNLPAWDGPEAAKPRVWPKCSSTHLQSHAGNTPYNVLQKKLPKILRTPHPPPRQFSSTFLVTVNHLLSMAPLLYPTDPMKGVLYTQQHT